MRNYAVETFEHAGLSIEIHRDEDPQNPREDNDGVIDHLICFHRRYSVGDKHDFKSSDYNGWDEMEAALIKEFDAVDIVPVYMYDHSGITIQTSPFSCPWDSGMIGFCLISRKAVLDNWSGKRMTKKLKKLARECIEGSVKEFDQFLTGDIYGYQIRKPVPEGEDEGDVIESCYGFYGMEYCREEAKSMAEGILAEEAKVAKENDPRQLKLAIA